VKCKGMRSTTRYVWPWMIGRLVASVATAAFIAFDFTLTDPLDLAPLRNSGLPVQLADPKCHSLAPTVFV